MSSYSRSDLATRVLRDLGLIGGEEVPSAADLQWSAETVGSEVALLGSIGLPIWNGSDLSVPLELVPLSPVFYGKALLWDKVLALGSTDAVTGEVAHWAGAIMAFYFGKRGIENVARIVGNRFGGR